MQFRLTDQDKTSIWKECRLAKNIRFRCVMTNNGLRLLLLFPMLQRKKNLDEEKRRDLCRCIANEIYFFSLLFFLSFFLYQFSFFFLFFSFSNRHTAQLFYLCSHARTHTSNIVLFVVVVVLTCFLFFIHLTISYILSSNKKKINANDKDLFEYCLSLLLRTKNK